MPTQKNDLLVIGELNMDLILNNVTSFPELGKEKIAGGLNLTLGSSSAIFAANAARLGLSTGFCGMIGDDNFGRSVIRELTDFGVDTARVVISPDHQTGLTAIIRHADDRAMVTYPGAMQHFSLKNIPEQTFEQSNHLHISSIFLQPGIKHDLPQIIEQALSHNMSISIDPQWDPDEQWDIDINMLLEKIDFFMPNEAEFLRLANTESVKKGLQKLGTDTTTIIVKRGKLGVTYLEGDTPRTVPAFTNDSVVDAIGAGDSFNAGFIYRFLRGYPLHESVKFGNLTGAVSTTASGGTAAISSFDAVLNKAKNDFTITNLNDFTR